MVGRLVARRHRREHKSNANTSDTSMPSGSGLKEPTLPLSLTVESTPGGDIFEGDVVNFTSEAPMISAGLPPPFSMSDIAPCPPNAALGDYLRRPVVLTEFDWTPATASFHIDPWVLFLNHSTVVPKLAQYRYVRGTLHLSVQVNGTPFHFGRLGVSYEPTNWNRISTDGDFRAHSGCQHVLIDPGANTIADFKCPFVSPFNWMDMTGGDLVVFTSTNSRIDSNSTAAIGVLNIDVLNALAIFQGGTPSSVEVLVYGWMENVDLAFPDTRPKIPFLSQGGDEYDVSPNAGLISGPSAVVAGIAKRLVGAPYIGPFAQATSVAASAVSTIAKLFGYSKPRVLETPRTMLTSIVGNMPNTDVADNAVSLTYNSKSELAVGPGLTGFDPGCDELSLQAIAGRWTYMRQVTWSSSQPSGTTLHEAGISPAMYTELAGDTLLASSLYFACAPFANWHGSIQVRLVIVASRFHRGRLRLSWAPSTTASSELNEAYTQIIDISSATEYCVTFPYMALEGYKYRKNTLFGDTYVPYEDSGVFRIMVQNRLVCPTTEPIHIMFFVRGGSDLRVATPVDPTSYSLYDLPAPAMGIIAEGDEEPDFVRQSGSLAELGVAASVDCVNVNFIPDSVRPDYDLAYFADPIVSFRPLIKRYSQTAILSYGVLQSYQTSRIVGRFPLYPHSPKVLPFVGLWVVNGTAATLTRPHLSCWLGYAFLGKRGGFRSIIDPVIGLDSNNAVSNIRVVRRQANDQPYWFRVDTETTSNVTSARSFLILQAQNTLVNGGQLFPTNPEGQRAAVELPYYSPLKYSSAVEPGTTASGAVVGDNSPQTFSAGEFEMQVTRRTTPVPDNFSIVDYNIYSAAAEDFNLFYFRGIPRINTNVGYSVAELSPVYNI